MGETFGFPSMSSPTKFPMTHVHLQMTPITSIPILEQILTRTGLLALEQ